MRIGLGSGRAVAAVIDEIGRRIADEGLAIEAVAASPKAARAARAAGMAMLPPWDIPELDLGLDGADLLTEELNLIKGGGGALVRERLVALACRRWVVLAEAEKLRLDLAGAPLPVAVLAFGHEATARRLRGLGLDVALRRDARGRPRRSDDGLLFYDCRDRLARTPSEIAAALAALPGVVDTGLFLAMAQSAYIGSPDGVRRIDA